MTALCFHFIFSPSVYAQDEHEVEPVRIVIMKIPGGGTRILAKKLSKLKHIALQNSSWLFNQSQKRGFSSNPKLLTKPKDLRWVMGGAKIDLIITCSNHKQSYKVDFISANFGKAEKTILVARGDQGLERLAAEKIKSEVIALFPDRLKTSTSHNQAVFKSQKKNTKKNQNTTPASEPRKLEKKTQAQTQTAKNWFFVSSKARMLKRDIAVGGRSGAMLSYGSAFYPGYELTAELFPMTLSAKDRKDFGIYFDFVQGFDAVKTTQEDAKRTKIPVGHYRIEGGFSYRTHTPKYITNNNDFIRARMRLTLRHALYPTIENAQLPSTSHTAVVWSGHIAYPLFFSGFAIEASAEFIPVGFWGDGLDQFGENAFMYGMGTSIGGLVSATDTISVSFGYTFDLHRTEFKGTGVMKFEDADAFELVQGLHLGVSLHM